ncbi:hypothetical protein VAWG006_32570 [Aeromonas enteropelogenes]|nr:hypothetical protein VAWG006_32570 [Aeromonas enteropelogenes]BEE23167.1 hypothetical protein VAWG007_32620 [Aeromonas enteropelogenes]
MIRRPQPGLENIVEHLAGGSRLGQTATGVAIEQQGKGIHGQFLVWGYDGATLAQRRMKKTPDAQGFMT